MRNSGRVAGAPPPVPVPPGAERGRPTSRRIEIRGRADRRSLVRLRRQGSETFDPEKEVDFPPVPNSERKCRNFFFCGAFIVWWGVIFGVAGFAFNDGNPARLIYGSDYQGNVCGDERGLKGNAPFVVFPRAEQDIDNNEIYVSVSTTLGFDFDPFDIDFFAVCQESCPKTGDFICTYEAEDQIAAAIGTDTREDIIRGCLENPSLTTYGGGSPCLSELVQKGCWEQFFDNVPVLFRCFPEFEYTVEILDDESECLITRNYSFGSSIQEVCVKFKEVSKVTRVEPVDSNPLFDAFNTFSRLFADLYADVVKAQYVIVGSGVGVAGTVGLLYVGSLWCCVGLVVWLTIFGCVALLLSFTLYCYFRAGILNEEAISGLTGVIDDFVQGTTTIFNIPGFENNTLQIEELPSQLSPSLDYQDEYEIGAYILTAVTIILLIIILGMISRISKAIQIFSEASRCVRANLSLLIVPPMGVAAMFAVMYFWAITTAHITTMGSIVNLTLPFGLEDELNITSFDLSEKVFGPFNGIAILNLFVFFGLLWTLAFISGTSHMIMSHVVGKWYWSGSPDDHRSAGKFAVCASAFTVFRYHMGTVAYGSLLISLIQIIRYIAAFIQHRFNSVQSQNRVLKYLFMSLNCCLKCAEMCVMFISKHAYVMAALYGTPFCMSTKMVFSAISHNLAQVGTVTFLGDIILRFGQILVTVTAGFAAWVYIDGAPEFNIGGDLQLSSFIFPVFLSMTLAWFVSYEIFNVYDVAVDTILISYCQDRKLVKIRADTHEPQYVKNRNLTDFIERNKSKTPIETQNSLSVLA